MNATAEQIDAILPQTQCRKCGFSGCKPYAEAIAQGRAEINQCPPGGEAGIIKLAALLGVTAKALNPTYGIEHPRRVATINEAACIGCTKCLPPCPTDAILGSSKHMHTVITAECTGCELCLTSCPVNCISMQLADDPNWTTADADRSRNRHLAKNLRLARQDLEKTERLQRQKRLLAQTNTAKN